MKLHEEIEEHSFQDYRLKKFVDEKRYNTPLSCTLVTSHLLNEEWVQTAVCEHQYHWAVSGTFHHTHRPPFPVANTAIGTWVSWSFP